MQVFTAVGVPRMRWQLQTALSLFCWTPWATRDLHTEKLTCASREWPCLGSPDPPQRKRGKWHPTSYQPKAVKENSLTEPWVKDLHTDVVLLEMLTAAPFSSPRWGLRSAQSWHGWGCSVHVEPCGEVPMPYGGHPGLASARPSPHSPALGSTKLDVSVGPYPSPALAHPCPQGGAQC